MTVFDYVAFAAMAVVFWATIYLVIAVGDLPAKIATERNHPQVAAVRALSWFGLLLTGGIAWIFAIVWAYYDYSKSGEAASTAALEAEIESLRERLGALESTVSEAGGAS